MGVSPDPCTPCAHWPLVSVCGARSWCTAMSTAAQSRKAEMLHMGRSSRQPKPIVRRHSVHGCQLTPIGKSEEKSALKAEKVYQEMIRTPSGVTQALPTIEELMLQTVHWLDKLQHVLPQQCSHIWRELNAILRGKQPGSAKVLLGKQGRPSLECLRQVLDRLGAVDQMPQAESLLRQLAEFEQEAVPTSQTAGRFVQATIADASELIMSVAQSLPPEPSERLQAFLRGLVDDCSSDLELVQGMRSMLDGVVVQLLESVGKDLQEECNPTLDLARKLLESLEQSLTATLLDSGSRLKWHAESFLKGLLSNPPPPALVSTPAQLKARKDAAASKHQKRIKSRRHSIDVSQQFRLSEDCEPQQLLRPVGHFPSSSQTVPIANNQRRRGSTSGRPRRLSQIGGASTPFSLAVDDVRTRDTTQSDPQFPRPLVRLGATTPFGRAIGEARTRDTTQSDPCPPVKLPTLAQNSAANISTL